jgi:hypothetical protein
MTWWRGKKDGLVDCFRSLSAAVPENVSLVWNSIVPAEDFRVATSDITEANTPIEALCRARRGCLYVDTWSFLAKDGAQISAQFRPDRVHLSARRYQRWTEALLHALFEMPHGHDVRRTRPWRQTAIGNRGEGPTIATFLHYGPEAKKPMSNINIQRAIENIRSTTTVYTPIVEMVVNAIEAIEDAEVPAGAIHLRVKRSSQQEIEVEEEGSRIVDVTVTDNGIGFTQQNRDSFDTFYSAQKIQKGGRGFWTPHLSSPL